MGYSILNLLIFFILFLASESWWSENAETLLILNIHFIEIKFLHVYWFDLFQHDHNWSFFYFLNIGFEKLSIYHSSSCIGTEVVQKGQKEL